MQGERLRRRVVASGLVGLVVFGLAACAGPTSWGPGVGFAMLLVALPVIWLTGLTGLTGRMARAGPPAPCTGYEESGCFEGRIQKQCCPAGAQCNFRNRPYTDCGQMLCVEMGDVGHCADPKAQVNAATTEEVCRAERGQWAVACIEGKVAKACLPPMPTNYMGPPANPAFKTCGEGADGRKGAQAAIGTPCTTNILVEHCYPAKEGAVIAPKVKPGVSGEDWRKTHRSVMTIADKACGQVPWGGYSGVTAKWTEVCLSGRVTQRCLPIVAEAPKFVATSFMTFESEICPKGQPKCCAIK